MEVTWQELNHISEIFFSNKVCFYSSWYTAKFITEDKNPFKQIQQGILEAPSHIKHKMNTIINPSEKAFNLGEHHFFRLSVFYRTLIRQDKFLKNVNTK